MANPKADIVFALAVIALSVVVYVGAMDLPPAYWEPLGSAAVPQALSVIMSLLSLRVLIRAGLALRTHVPKPRTDEGFKRRPMTAAGMFVLCVLYVAAMDSGLLGFIEATIAFLIALGVLFTRAQRSQLPWIAGFAVVIAVANYFVFTQILYVDLPTAAWW